MRDPGGRWHSGHARSLNGELRDEQVNLEAIGTSDEAQTLLERRHCSRRQVRPAGRGKVVGVRQSIRLQRVER
jgi:hypothetical protein